MKLEASTYRNEYEVGLTVNWQHGDSCGLKTVVFADCYDHDEVETTLTKVVEVLNTLGVSFSRAVTRGRDGAFTSMMVDKAAYDATIAEQTRRIETLEGQIDAHREPRIAQLKQALREAKDALCQTVNRGKEEDDAIDRIDAALSGKETP